MTACEQAYINGFRQKCAEFGVDPEKMAQAKPAQLAGAAAPKQPSL